MSNTVYLSLFIKLFCVSPRPRQQTLHHEEMGPAVSSKNIFFKSNLSLNKFKFDRFARS